MQPISLETIEFIESFIKSLNAEQLMDNLNSVKEKQPVIFDFIWELKEDMPEENKFVPVLYLYMFMVRCYDYFYGNLEIVSEDTSFKTLLKLHDFFKYSRKKINHNKVINEINKWCRQSEMSEYLNVFLLGTEEFPCILNPLETLKVKTQFLLAFNMLNDQVEVNYPETEG